MPWNPDGTRKKSNLYKKPAAGKFMTQGGSMVASMAAQRNMMPNQFTANTNPNEIQNQNQNQMKPSTFTMKHNKSSFPFKSSPAKVEDNEKEAVSTEVYVDRESTVTSNRLQKIDNLINTHNKNLKETKAWDDTRKTLQKRRSEEIRRIQAEREAKGTNR